MLQLSPPESRLGKEGSMSSAEGATADAVAGLGSRAAEWIVTFLSHSKWESIAADSSKHCLSSTPPTCRCSCTQQQRTCYRSSGSCCCVSYPMQVACMETETKGSRLRCGSQGSVSTRMLQHFLVVATSCCE